MPITRTVKNVMGTLSEEIVKKDITPSRTPHKELKEIPTEVKELEPDLREVEAAKILDEDKSQQFIGVRQEDITKERGKTFVDIEKTQQKIDTTIDEDKYAILLERQDNLYRKARDLKIEKERVADIEEAKTRGISAYESLNDSIASTPGVGRTGTNIEARTTSIYNRVNAGMSELKDTLRTKKFGLKQNLEIADEIVRFLKDGKVKNESLAQEVKKIADQWTTAADKIKSVRNKSGAKIGTIEDWIVPQSHDGQKIRKAGYETWKKNITSKLDKERIEAEQGKPLDDALETAYKNITAPKVESTQAGGTSVLTKKGDEARVLHFKNGDDIIAYKNEYGNPDIFSTMDSHIRQQSNEIAMMQIYGSNPEQTFNKLKELARADGMGSTREMLLDAQFRVSSGQADGDNIVDKLDATLAAVGGGHRSIQVASKLGTALVSSLADIGNIVLGAGYRNLNSVKIAGKGLQTIFQEITSGGSAADNILLANRIGVVSEFASASLANSRFAETTGAGVLQKSAEAVIRASGLGSYTNSLRASFGLEFAGNLADNFSKKLDDVPFAPMLKEYGIDDAMWDTIRSTQKRNVKGAEFIDMGELYKVNEEIGYRVSEMITNEMNAFVIMPGDRVRKWTTAGKKKGTVSGELMRNITLFKSFPISVAMLHLNRIGNIDTTMGKVAYSGKVIGVNTIMGGITLWAYDTVSGKTTRSVDRPSFVAESIAKSGGLGIFADFFVGMTDTGYGNSMTATLVGVPYSTIEDIARTAQDLIHKDADKAAGNIYKRAKNYIPGQNLWYTRAVIERTVGDFIGEAVDPDHRKKMRRRQKTMNLRSQELLFK